jgi:hypothetical protein
MKNKSVRKIVQLTEIEREFLKKETGITDAELGKVIEQYNAELAAQIEAGEISEREWLEARNDFWDNEQQKYVRPERKQFGDLFEMSRDELRLHTLEMLEEITGPDKD